MFFTKYTIFAEKNVFIWKKKFYIEFFLLKKLFLQRKVHIKMSEIYISFEKYKIFVLQIKYKSLNIKFNIC